MLALMTHTQYRHRTPFVRLCLIVAVIAAACSDPVSPSTPELDNAEARWRARTPATSSYTMQQRVSCFCPAGGDFYDVTVVNGAITGARNAVTGSAAEPWLMTRLRTVDQLFAELRTASAASGTLKAVSYDATMGYPTVVSLDPIPQAVDDEVSYSTRSVALTP